MFILTCILLVVGGRAAAQEKGKESSLPKGFRGEFLTQLMDDEKKMIDLASAIPEEKYSWRPAEGVRSIGEVYTHIAGANFGFPGMMGVKASPNAVKDAEAKMTEKKKILEYLKLSFDYVREAAMMTSDADLEKPAKFFGQETSVRGILFNLATHLHEHMGQSIAYARSNGIVPPWTAAEMKQQETKK